MSKVDASKKRVLLVADAFPPQLGGRSEKVASKAKYFSRYGWEVVVLAPALASDDQQDAGLLYEDTNISVYRTPYLFRHQWPSLKHNKGRLIDVQKDGWLRLVDFLAIPRGYIRWLPCAIRAGVRLGCMANVIFTMSNPVALHIIGFILSQWTGKPWVAEFRDPLVGYAYSRRGPEWINRRLESLVVHNADRIIRLQDFVPDPICIRYPDVSVDKFAVIPFVGYDPDDFVASGLPLASQTDAAVLQVAYTGSFYGDTITPISFLKGFRRFLSETSISSASFRVVFAGDWDAPYDQTLNDLGLQGYVKYLGYLTRQECINLWQTSHVLLLILGKERDNLMRIPSKFWDYLGARRSILALVHPDGRVAQVVREQRLGFVADPEDDASITATLREMWQAHQRGTLKPQPSAKFLARATRASSEKMVIDVMNELVRAKAASE